MCSESAHNALIHWMEGQGGTDMQENCCNVARFRGSHSGLLLKFKASDIESGGICHHLIFTSQPQQDSIIEI
jgi:hypothetical protein